MQTHWWLALHTKPPSIAEVQSAVAAHSTHVRVVGSHAGIAALVHSAPSLGSQAPHAPVCGPLVAHTVPAVIVSHCASLVQPTQLALIASQMGVSPLQSVSSIGSHWPHAPVRSPWRTHTMPGHCASSVQALQLRPVASQTGVVPEQPPPSPGSHAAQRPAEAPLVTQNAPPVRPAQSASVAQATHVALVAEQTGVAAGHTFRSAGSQAPHAPILAPLDTHTPVVHSPSPSQPRHTWPSHTGVVPLQSSDVAHCTHAFVVVSHTMPIAAHADASLASQATHAPARSPVLAHTGAAARSAQSPLLAHAAQA